MHKPLLNETKHKILSVLIVTIGALLGFEAISGAIGIYQIKTGLYLSFYIYAFHIFWLTFLFDMHLKTRGVWGNNLREALRLRFAYMKNWYHFRHFQNYLVLPGIIYWGTVILLLLNPFDTALKQGITICSTIALSVAYWFMKEHISKRLEHQDHWIRILSLVKIYAAFILFSATVGVTFYYGFNSSFLFLSVFTLTFLLIYQALFQHRLLSFQIFAYVLLIAVVLALASLWIFNNWNTEYFAAGLVLLAVYNSLWGILHHHLDKTLTKKIAVEYMAMSALVITIVLASHNFSQRVI
jgi:hypothetical protein